MWMPTFHTYIRLYIGRHNQPYSAERLASRMFRQGMRVPRKSPMVQMTDELSLDFRTCPGGLP
jgi:hypothetical protein